MSRLVLDASAAIAVLADEPMAGQVTSVLGRNASDGVQIMVPAHFWLEVVNVLRVGHGLDGRAITGAIHRLDSFDLETFDLDRAQLLLVIDAIERYGLTAYDAAYLVLAWANGAPLLTLDRELAIAAGSLAVPLDSAHRLSDQRAAFEHDVTWPMYAESGRYLAKLRADALLEREAARG